MMERARMSVNAAINAWRGFGQGSVPIGVNLLHLPPYETRWLYYTNEIFSREFGLRQPEYLRAGLYAGIKALYNPTQRLVDFYRAKVYPGILTEDGRPLPEGIAQAVPFAKDMTPQLKAACAQLFQWTNAAELLSVMVTWGAALGDLLIEVDDDRSGGKLRYTRIWPADVKHIVQEAGNLKSYVLEYNSRDDRGPYKYRKEVDKFTISTYRDGILYAYGDMPAEYQHEYGFVPARWIRHKAIGSDRGAPAMNGTYSKVNDLMSLASHLHHQVHRTVEGDMVVASGSNIVPSTGVTFDPNDPSKWVRDPAEAVLWKAPLGTTAFPLIVPLALGEALLILQDLQNEIKADRPEISAYEQMHRMSGDLSGIAVERLLGDAQAPLLDAQVQYDAGLISLLQMGIAIAGHHYNRRNDHSLGYNGWSRNTIQQQRFAAFDLDSYEAGNLNIVIEPRPIIPSTTSERALAKAQRWQGVKTATDAGAPLALAMADFDFTKDQITATVLAQAERQARAAQIQENIQNSQQNGAQPQQQGANNGANNG
jgi:hypothetical protein